jgi:hypothetical protein
LDGIRLAEAHVWDTLEEEFPYSFIFGNILPGRVCSNNGTLSIRLSPDAAEQTVDGVRAIGADSHPGFGVKEHFQYPSSEARDFSPFTCVRIGPFPAEGGRFLLRLECHIGEPSFGDLIPEDRETGTRTYKVYGPDHIFKHIAAFDIPQCLASVHKDTYRKAVEFFTAIDKSRVVMPSRYGIIAIDNPNCNPRQLHARDLTDDLRDITADIPQSLYDHDVLAKIPNRLHWFTCDVPSRGFFLQLSGPMALAELCTKGG